MFPGPNCLPAGGKERPGELKEGPCPKDQNAGVRTEAGEVSVLLFTDASAHPQHTRASPSLEQLKFSIFFHAPKVNDYSCVNFSLIIKSAI